MDSSLSLSNWNYFSNPLSSFHNAALKSCPNEYWASNFTLLRRRHGQEISPSPAQQLPEHHTHPIILLTAYLLIGQTDQPQHSAHHASAAWTKEPAPSLCSLLSCCFDKQPAPSPCTLINCCMDKNPPHHSSHHSPAACTNISIPSLCSVFTFCLDQQTHPIFLLPADLLLGNTTTILLFLSLHSLLEQRAHSIALLPKPLGTWNSNIWHDSLLLQSPTISIIALAQLIWLPQ